MQGTVTEAEVQMRAKKPQFKFNLCPQDAHIKGEKACKQKHTLKCLRCFMKKSVQSGWGMDAGVADSTGR